MTGKYNEYGLKPIAGVLLMTRLRNQLNAIDPALETKLSNICINGQKRGCSGFITDPATGAIVYVHVEDNDYSRNAGANAYFRTAKSTRDYQGGRNHLTTKVELAYEAVQLLKQQSSS